LNRLREKDRTFFFYLVISLIQRKLRWIFVSLIRFLNVNISNSVVSYLISLLWNSEFMRVQTLKVLVSRHPRNSIPLFVLIRDFRGLVWIKNEKNYAIFSYLVLLGIYLQIPDLVYSSFIMFYLQVHYYNDRSVLPYSSYLRTAIFIWLSIIYLASLGICIVEIYCGIITPILTYIVSIILNLLNGL
jgi:hypothetical protein